MYIHCVLLATLNRRNRDGHMMKGFQMAQGAFIVRLTTVLLATSFFISSPAAMAQASDPGDTAIKTLAPAGVAIPDRSGSGTSSLTASFPDGSKNTVVADAANPPADDAAGGDAGGLDSAGSSSAGDGAALAQSTGPTVSGKGRLDPAYTKLPLTKGTVKIRRQFKLFATEKLIHNLSFRDTPVKEVLSQLASMGSLNVLIDKSCYAKVTGELHDVTLNEAMDSVLAAAGLVSRTLDNNTVIIGSQNAMTQLGLNRMMARVFKLSYASPFEVAGLLHTSVFNKGVVPDMAADFTQKWTNLNAESPKTQQTRSNEQVQAGIGEGGGQRKSTQAEQNSITMEGREDDNKGAEFKFSTKIDNQRTLKGSSRTQVQEGTGFNNAAQDPGTQQIRAYQEVPTDYIVEQNGAGAIAIPDARNRQVIVVGTPDDLAVAEECIRLVDQRPKQVHIQLSLLELQNQGIRQLGASLNLQGQGASAQVLGGAGAPLINFLPGLGSLGPNRDGTTQRTFNADNNSTSTQNIDSNINIVPPVVTTTLDIAESIARSLVTQDNFNSQFRNTIPALTGVPNPNTGYQGFLGNFFPQQQLPSLVGVRPNLSSTSAFNFLTLGRRAGGRANIATLPTGLNLNINLLLQTNKAKVLANPSVIVSDNTESLITLATEVIHKVTSTVSLGVTNVNVELTKAGIFLDVLPKVGEDGFITMRLRPQVSAPVGGEQRFANDTVIVTLLNIREIMTQEVRIKDGQTLVIGGLFTEQEAAQMGKVPYLAETPLFGALFRNTLKGRNRTELLLMLTPKIVEDQPYPTPPIADAGSGVKM